MYLVLYPFMAFASIFCVLLTWALAPLLALFVGADGNLPDWCYWFQTFDNTCDAGWKVQGNYGTYLVDGTMPAGITLWWYRVRWLWRNPAYGWDYWPLGIAFDAGQWRVVVNNARWWIAVGPRRAFCIRYLATSGVGLKLGWKAWAYWQNGVWAPSSYSWGPSGRMPVCFTL
ncbi:hypothetical protein J4G52_25310 [Burkholderia cenocepacia]|uniref:DUF7338 family protein n=1 Tax=Burkholderia cenocepacia TaxID=95486 RepID=UPI001AA0C876|nr:hypothetical protein [Burkholderia cenocepacia]MBO1856862.1 hypothetical protein [Burkholderia cenocepacia]